MSKWCGQKVPVYKGQLWLQEMTCAWDRTNPVALVIREFWESDVQERVHCCTHVSDLNHFHVLPLQHQRVAGMGDLPDVPAAAIHKDVLWGRSWSRKSLCFSAGFAHSKGMLAGWLWVKWKKYGNRTRKMTKHDTHHKYSISNDGFRRAWTRKQKEKYILNNSV